jgi:peroxiredoxin
MPLPSNLSERVGAPLPDVALAAADGTAFGLRGRVGAGPLVLFFYIANGTPG